MRLCVCRRRYLSWFARDGISDPAGGRHRREVLCSQIFSRAASHTSRIWMRASRRGCGGTLLIKRWTFTRRAALLWANVTLGRGRGFVDGLTQLVHGTGALPNAIAPSLEGAQARDDSTH